MDKQKKQMIQMVRQSRRRKYGGVRDDEELLHEAQSPQQDSHSPDMMQLHGLIGNQAVQRLMGDEKKPSKKSGKPYPFLPTIQSSIYRVLAADAPQQKADNGTKLDEELGQPTQEKTQEEQMGGDFTDGKDPAKDLEDRTIIAAANTKVSLEGLLTGVYKQLPEDTMKEFQEVHDTIRTSLGHISQKTREKAREAFDNLKIVVDATKDKKQEPVVDPLDNSPDDAEGMKADVIKAAMKARSAITDILSNKPDVAEDAMEDAMDDQQKEIQAAAADGDENKIVQPDIGAIKSMGFVMRHDEALNEYVTLAKDVRSSDAGADTYAEQRVVEDLINTPPGNTVIILSAYEPIQKRRQAILDLAFKRMDLRVFVCYVNGATIETDNRLIEATHGGWRDIMDFR
jgi:hypothetical protein